jgi:hypothetical protein
MGLGRPGVTRLGYCPDISYRWRPESELVTETVETGRRSCRPLPSIPCLQRWYRVGGVHPVFAELEFAALPQTSSLPCPAGRFPRPRYSH